MHICYHEGGSYFFIDFIFLTILLFFFSIFLFLFYFFLFLKFLLVFITIILNTITLNILKKSKRQTFTKRSGNLLYFSPLPKIPPYPDLLMSTSFSMPCVSRSFLAASRLSAMTSLIVFSTETTVSSERFFACVCCPPGRFFTKLGMACLPMSGITSEPQ